MDASDIIITDRQALQEVVHTSIRQILLEEVPTAIKKAERGKWMHRDEIRNEYGLTDRQLQYLRDNNRIEFSQHGRRIWYLRESVEDYFDEGRVEAQGGD
jgi:hypothetical protein